MSTWQELPPPPSPTGINQFPSDPPRFLAWRQDLPDRSETSGFGGATVIQEWVENVFTIHQWWIPLFSATASASLPFEKSITITEGTEVSETVTTTFSSNLGIKIGDLLTLGSAITQMISRTVRFYQSRQTTLRFSVTPKETLTVVRWQKVTEFKMSGKHRAYFPFLPPYEKPEATALPDAVFQNLEETFPITQFPPNADADSAIKWSEVDDKTSASIKTEEEDCTECLGSGSCRRCGGTGSERCTRCNGTGKIGEDDCSVCLGAGSFQCVSCSGSTKCFRCNGTGKIPKIRAE